MSGTRSVTDQVALFIQENITNGSWPLGSKIPSESQLCQTLGVSRTSVRSAIQQFIAIGAIESIHGKGSFVRSQDLSRLHRSDTVSYGTLQEALQFCALIRPAICVQAMEQGDPGLLPDLKDILDQMHSLRSEQITELTDMVSLFYQRILDTFQNNIMDRTREQLEHIMRRYPPTPNENVYFYGTLYYHNAILEAIEHQDAERLSSVVYNYYSNMPNFYQFADLPVFQPGEPAGVS